MTTANVKPCPLCEKPGVIRHVKPSGLVTTDRFYPECSHCPILFDCMFETEAEAIAAWNTRALSAPPPAVAPQDGIKCPFCGEAGFDALGLKYHLDVFGCLEYENVAPLPAAPEKSNG